MLTKTQRKVLAFLQQYFVEHDCSPTLAEIATGIGIKSRGVIHGYLKVLAETNLIKLIPRKHRNIQLVIGISDPQLAALSEKMLGDAPSLIFKVPDNSMIEENICDGDIAICHRTTIASSGDIVVAQIDGEFEILQRLHQENELVTLMPANAALEAITYAADRVQIRGIYKGLVRCPSDE